MTTLYQATKEYSSGEPGYCDREWAISGWYTTKKACKEDCARKINGDPLARCGSYVGKDDDYTWCVKNE